MSPKTPSKSQKPSTSGNTLFTIAVLAVVGGGAYLFLRPSSPVATTAETAVTDTVQAFDVEAERAALGTSPAKPGQPDDYPLPDLPLDQFSSARPVDVVRAAYEFAAEHPEVLQYVPCFCGCESLGHSGNDDCFVRARDAEGRVLEWEPHGVACAVCLDVGTEARRMYASGASVTQIRDAIEAKYRPLASTITPTPMPEGHAH
jgi:hypothetical protein